MEQSFVVTGFLQPSSSGGNQKSFCDLQCSTYLPFIELLESNHYQDEPKLRIKEWEKKVG